MANRPTYVWTGSEWDTIADPGAVRNTGGSTITVSTGSTVPLTIQNNGTGNSFVVNDVASDTTPFVVDASGNVGVGVSSPSTKLDVDGIVKLRGGGGEGGQIDINNPDNAAVGLSIDVSTSDIGRVFQTRNNSVLQLGQLAATGGIIQLFTGNTLRMEIGATGRISIPPGGVLEAPVATNAQTTSYTLVFADAGKLIEINSASATTLTIPADASVAFPVGTKIDVLQTGAGQVTIAGSGFTPNATPGLKISAQWGAASLVKRGTNSWVVIGNLSA